MSHKSSLSSPKPEFPVTPGRTLVLCFDGTAGQYDGYNTNAVKLFALLKKDDFREQLCYYQPGVGTYLNPSTVSPIFEWCAKVLDEAFAIFLNDHVMDGYRFLMENYRKEDKICLFGFSRGSYTARALAGMLHKVGLLPRDNQEQIPFAFKMYQNNSTSGIALAAGYKQTFCQTVPVEFMGVWDTVSSVGVFMGRTLPFTGVNATIKTFRHAVSLDEHRVRFMPYLLEPKLTDSSIPKDELPPTDALECWFSGCHSDIGGGNVQDDVARSLSDITLRWMVRQIMASDCGILFDADALKRATIPVIAHSSSVAVSPEIRSIDDENSSQQLFDSLAGFSAWKPLEILPLTWSVQDVQGAWHRKFGFHLGKGRPIVDPKPNFHVTVKERMANTTLKYRPKAQWVAGTEVYIE
ncbi:hypothetical protein C8F04DRAFT_1021023 [Mycena alexandri]|uniref:T6SS Phospholipase effector Tle1-like catalytic domain-containing protein n=1 Tax=Mycena alexandri TaxID=1745969 RepID=A0AAD6RVF4_9AGAR|nr:hypothetical protein C8F04DRAFT_1021023 [Mycena alexandri]